MVKVQEENGALQNEVQELKRTNSEQLNKMQVAHLGSQTQKKIMPVYI